MCVWKWVSSNYLLPHDISLTGFVLFAGVKRATITFRSIIPIVIYLPLKSCSFESKHNYLVLFVYLSWRHVSALALNHLQVTRYTGRFIMFSMISNTYNKKTKGPNLMELFTATGKLTKFILTNRDVRFVHNGWHGTNRYDIQVLATRASTWVHRYSSLLRWSVTLGQRGHVAMVGRILCTKCTLHSNHRLTVWYSNTQNDFFP